MWLTGVLSSHLSPALKDYVFPLDENRSHDRLWILDGEYMIDRNIHYWKLYAFEAAASWTTALTLLGR